MSSQMMFEIFFYTDVIQFTCVLSFVQRKSCHCPVSIGHNMRNSLLCGWYKTACASHPPMHSASKAVSEDGAGGIFFELTQQ